MKSVLRLLLLILALVGGALGPVATGPAVAQQSASTLDYESWERTAQRANEAINAGRASTAALEKLRTELAQWRQRFQSAQNENANAIATVEGQLEALGPAPENGGESPEIALQREQLNKRLNELKAPVKSAELAHSEAEGLIKGIDQIVRDRQAEELLELGPSPINPAHWGEGLTALSGSVTAVQTEFAAAWRNSAQQQDAKESLPAVIVLILAGLLLLTRGRRWSRRLSNHVLGDQPGAGRWIAGFTISLGSMILPFLGVVALTEAVYATDLVGLHGNQMIAALLPSVFIYLLVRWLAMRIFPSKEARTLPLNLDPAQRHSGRWYGAALGLVVAGYFFLKQVADYSGWSDAAENVVLFPLMVLSGLLLLRLTGLLKKHSRAAAAEEGEEGFRTRITRLLALALAVLAVASPALASVGYFTLAHFLMFPTLASLLLLAVLLVLQRLVTEVYVLITGNREGAAESLIPVLFGFVLVICSLPLFALVWGARVADLTELWTRFTEGVTFGETRISPTIFMTLAIVFLIGLTATRLVQGALRNTVLPKTRIDPGGRNAIVSGIGYIGIFLAAIIAITSAGIDLTALGYVAGALSVGIGFGLQNIVSNFVSGIILLVERPISEGDWIEVGGVHGTVRDISVRSTVIETFDRSDVILPNSDLISGRVTNYTRGNTVGRVIVPVGVAYGSDTRKVEQILQEIGENHPLVLANPAPYAVFVGFGESSMDFEIRAILRDVNWVLNVKSEMNHQIAQRFAEEGIEVPFAQRDIWIRNPEAFSGGSERSGPAAQSDAPADRKGDASAHLTGPDIDTNGESDGADK